jgi:PAS domain S-box-containing protein
MNGWLWQPHVALLFGGTVVSLLASWLAWIRRRNPVARYLIRLVLASCLWIFGSFVEAGVTALDAKLFWTQIQYSGLVTVPPYLLLFILSYTRREYLITNTLRWVLAVITIGIALAVFTNHWHLNFYTGYAFNPQIPNVLIYYHGPLYYLSQVFFYTQIGAGLLILANDTISARPPYRRQLIYLQLAIVLPAAVGIFYTLRMTPLDGLDWTPLTAVASSLILIWSLYRFQLLTVVPVAYEAVFANVGKAIFVLNQEDRILDLNPAAERLSGFSVQQLVGRSWSEIRHHLSADALPTEIGAATAQQPLSVAEVRIGPAQSTRYFEVTTFPFVDPVLRMNGRLVVFQDITARKQVEAELRELNAHLEQKVLEQTADLRAAQDQLARRLSEQSRKLAGLYDVILLSGDLQRDGEQLLDHALAKVRSIIDSDQLIFLSFGDTLLRPRAVCSRDGLAPLTLPELPLDWFSKAVQVRVINDLPADAGVPAALAASGYRTCMVRWLSSSEGISGALLTLWQQNQPISIEDVELFNALTDELSLMLEIEHRRREATRYAVIEERHRLARDLHDSITQSLHSLMLTAENARSVAHSDPQRLEQFLLHLLGSARHALTETRLLLFELRPQGALQQGLPDLLQVRLESVERRVGIDTTLSIVGETPWPTDWERNLYALALEALNNSLKHAQASEVGVVITSTPDRFALRISDNGRGFVPSRSSRGGMGMNTMADRARQLGGILSIESVPGYGTHVELVVHRSVGATELSPAATSSVA